MESLCTEQEKRPGEWWWLALNQQSRVYTLLPSYALTQIHERELRTKDIRNVCASQSGAQPGPLANQVLNSSKSSGTVTPNTLG